MKLRAEWYQETYGVNCKECKHRLIPEEMVSVMKINKDGSEANFFECPVCYNQWKRESRVLEALPSVKRCPVSTCRRPLSRDGGCYTMDCLCGVKWCWLCGEVKKQGVPHGCPDIP